MHETRWEFCPPKVVIEPSFRNHFLFLISATGEPALLMGISVLFAIWDALNSYKVEAGQTGWWQLSKLTTLVFLILRENTISDGPATVEHIHQHAGVTPDQFTF